MDCGECGFWSVAEEAILPAARAWVWGSGVGRGPLVSALLEAEAVAVHLEDVDVVGEPVEQSAREPF